MILICFGVVVTTTRGSGPSRSPNISVPRLWIPPGGYFITPRCIVLRPPQALRLVGAVGCRNGPVRPGQPALCWLVLRPQLRWPDRQQATLAFDHDIAGIGCGRRDQRDPAAAVMDDLVANTLRTAAGLAKAATGQQQPGPPIAFRRLLVGPPPPAPIVLDRFELAVTRLFQERRQLFRRQRCEQFGA